MKGVLLQTFNSVGLILSLVAVIGGIVFQKWQIVAIGLALMFSALSFQVVLNRRKILVGLDYLQHNMLWYRQFKQFVLLPALVIILIVAHHFLSDEISFSYYLGSDRDVLTGHKSLVDQDSSEVGDNIDYQIILKKELDLMNFPVEVVINEGISESSPIRAVVGHYLSRLNHPNLVVHHRLHTLGTDFDDRQWVEISGQGRKVELDRNLLYRRVEFLVDKSNSEKSETNKFATKNNRVDSMTQYFLQHDQIKASLLMALQYIRLGTRQEGRVLYFSRPDQSLNSLAGMANWLKLNRVDLEFFEYQKYLKAEVDLYSPEYFRQFGLFIIDARFGVSSLVEKFVMENLSNPRVSYLILIDPIIEKGPIAPHGIFLLGQLGFKFSYQNFTIQDCNCPGVVSRYAHPMVPELRMNDRIQFAPAVSYQRPWLTPFFKGALALQHKSKLSSEFSASSDSSDPSDLGRTNNLGMKSGKAGSALTSSPYQPVIHTTKDSWMEVNFLQELTDQELSFNKNDVAGPHHVAWLRESGRGQKSRVMVVGDSDFLAGEFFTGMNQWFTSDLINNLRISALNETKSSAEEEIRNKSTLVFNDPFPYDLRIGLVEEAAIFKLKLFWNCLILLVFTGWYLWWDRQKRRDGLT